MDAVALSEMLVAAFETDVIRVPYVHVFFFFFLIGFWW
jgi:hypothetical protein